MSAYFGPGGNSDAFKLAGKKSTVEAPGWVRSIGLDAYEYEAGNGLAASPAMLSAIGNKAREHGVKMSFHTPYFISLSGVVEEKRLNSINYIRQSLDAANLLGAGTIVVHSGSAAKIGLETMGKINQLGTLDEVLELCRIDSAFVPVVDFGHLNARDLGGVFVSADDYLRVFD